MAVVADRPGIVGGSPGPACQLCERDLVLVITCAVIAATLVGQGLTLPPLIDRLGLVSRDEQARRRLAVLALATPDELTREGVTPADVTARASSGYEAPVAQTDRRIELLVDGETVEPEHGGGETGPGAFEAEQALRCRAIDAERDELDRMLARRSVSRPVADEVPAALDVDETTMRP